MLCIKLFQTLKPVVLDGRPNINNGMKLEEAELMLDAFGGFLIFVSRNGRIIYASEHISRYLGVAQVNDSIH